MKKFVAVLLALVCVFGAAFSVSAADLSELKPELVAQFEPAVGPEVNGRAIDYRYYSPVESGDTQKYPLVVWLHGMGEGSSEGSQVSGKNNNIAYWTSDDFQSRFAAGGAFILAPRSPENEGIFWSEAMIEPLRALIDDFVANNQVDVTRIYIGGFSMGGKMTLNMAVAYPEMFAAAMPVCAAWSASAEQLSLLADLPVWLTSSKKDPLVNYYLGITPMWNKLCSVSNVAENCRFSTLTTVCFEDGTKAQSGHHSWFAVNHDMFAENGEPYPNLTTVNGLGEAVELEYPNGMISWLNGCVSSYDATPIEGKGNLEGMSNIGNIAALDLTLCDLLRGIFNTLRSMIFE